MAIHLAKDLSPFLYSPKDWTSGASTHERGVSVILRTRNRPEFLERAIKSIAGQTYADIALCLINDGGDAQTVEGIVKANLSKNIVVEYFHLAPSIGQAAALNYAFDRVARQYFAIHDDDDTWAPDFLAEMVSFLQTPLGGQYIGAVSFAQVIEERLDKNGITIVNRRPSHRYDRVLSLFQSLHLSSQPPPISILMRHECLKIVSHNNLAMSVMYDVEWMTRILLNADVAVVPKELAFYHHRVGDNDTLGSARNSVFELESEFYRLRVMLQNEQLRSELSNGKLGVGFISSLMDHLHEHLLYDDMVRHFFMRQAKRYFRRRALIRKLESFFKLGGRKR